MSFNRKVVMSVKFGSHLYGTNTAASDEDYKSIYIPPARDILLQRVQDSIQIGKKSKAEGEKNAPTDIDNECYSLQRYLSLLAEGQTAAIDMLFAPDLLISSDIWTNIQFNREKLLTKKSASFVGYCRTQANKYGIKGSRVAEAKNAMLFFEGAMAEFGTSFKVKEAMAAYLGQDGRDAKLGEHTQIVTKETTQGHVETYYESCNRMIGFNSTVKEAASVFRKIYENYGARARMAESNEGVDWKALSHAVRVAREALELLALHYITFPLPYAAHILDIKQGKLPYQQVAEEIEKLLLEVEEAAVHSTLPDKADQQFIDDLVASVYGEQVGLDTSHILI